MECIRCGWCCKRSPCWLAYYLNPKMQSGQCPHLTYVPYKNATIAFCNLVGEAAKSGAVKSQAARRLVDIGQGCTHLLGPDLIALYHILLAQKVEPPSIREILEGVKNIARQQAQKSEEPIKATQEVEIMIARLEEEVKRCAG